MGNSGFNWKYLKTKIDAYILRLNGIYASNLSKDAVDLIKGEASFVDSNTIKVNDCLYTGKHILLATGSSPWIPNTPGATEFGMTSDGFFELEVQPKHVVIVGAGYIAVELAGIFSALGTKVTMVIRHEQILRSFDNMIREEIMQCNYCFI